MSTPNSPDPSSIEERFQRETLLRKQIEEDLNLRLRQQEAIARLGEHAIAATDLKHLFQEAVQLLHDILDVEFTKILELLPDGNNLEFKAVLDGQNSPRNRRSSPAVSNPRPDSLCFQSEPVIVEVCRAKRDFPAPTFC
jgi:GAF domain-containing protein